MESMEWLDAWIACTLNGKIVQIHFMGNMLERMAFQHWSWRLCATATYFLAEKTWSCRSIEQFKHLGSQSTAQIFLDGTFVEMDFNFEINGKQFTKLYFHVDGI